MFGNQQKPESIISDESQTEKSILPIQNSAQDSFYIHLNGIEREHSETLARLQSSNEENRQLRQEIEELKQKNRELQEEAEALRRKYALPASHEPKDSIVSTSSASFFSPEPSQPVSKTPATTSSSSSSQLENINVNKLQNELIIACYNADIEKVKNLIEIQHADPSLPNEEGMTALAAAILGFAFSVLHYLESKVDYQEQDWIDTAKIIQRKHGSLISFTNETTTFQQLVTHYESKKQSFLYDPQALELRRLQALQTPYLGTNLAYLKHSLFLGSVVMSVHHKPAVYKKHGQLLEIRTPLKGKAKIIHYEWGAGKELNKLKIGREGGSVYLFWQLSNIMTGYLYDKGIKLSVNYTKPLLDNEKGKEKETTHSFGTRMRK